MFRPGTQVKIRVAKPYRYGVIAGYGIEDYNSDMNLVYLVRLHDSHAGYLDDKDGKLGLLYTTLIPVSPGNLRPVSNEEYQERTRLV